MKIFLKTTVAVAGCVLALSAVADSRVDSVWNCELNEGKEMKDVHAANAQWVSHMNSVIDGGGITSGTETAIVGNQGNFYFVDSYPSLSTWAAAQEYTDSDEGKAAMEEIQGQFEDLFECKDNELFKYTPN